MFGGKTFTLVHYNRILHTTFWNNYHAPKNKSVPSAIIGEENNISFPGKEDWETRFEDSFYYSINGVAHLAMFFSSFQSAFDLIRTGRFSCAILGVAVFKQTGNSWQLEEYNPSIGCFGMFGSPHKPHKIKLGANKYGFYITNGIQGPGGTYYGNVFLFKLADNIPQLLMVNNAERFNTLYTNWWFDIETAPENDTLKLKIEGYINNEDLEKGEEENWPQPYTKLAKKRETIGLHTTKPIYRPPTVCMS